MFFVQTLNRQHIEIGLNMDELDVTDAEKKATYSEIKEYVMAHYGYKMPTGERSCYHERPATLWDDLGENNGDILKDSR